MKKAKTLLLLLIIILSLSACGSDGQTEAMRTESTQTEVMQTENTQTEAEQTDDPTRNEELESDISDDNTLDELLSEIEVDFDSTIMKLTEELSAVYVEIGDSYDSYVENEYLIKEWYDLAQGEAEGLFERTAEKSISYYKAVADTVDHSDSDALDDSLDDFYDKVYEDAYNSFYEIIYEDSFDELYDTYYDGIVDDAQDSIDYGDWIEVRSDCYSDWLDARSDIYSTWLDERSDIYGDWLDINSEFLYDDNFDVDDILSITEETLPTDASDETTIDSTSANEEWLQFLKEYEEWVDDYIAIVKKYKENPTDMTILADYTEMLSEMSDWTEKADEIELELEGTDAALEYSTELLRIAAKLAEAAY